MVALIHVPFFARNNTGYLQTCLHTILR